MDTVDVEEAGVEAEVVEMEEAVVLQVAMEEVNFLISSLLLFFQLACEYLDTANALKIIVFITIITVALSWYLPKYLREAKCFWAVY